MPAIGYLPHPNFLIDRVRRIIGTRNALKRLQLDDIFNCMQLQPHETALDFGCSTGYMTYQMARQCGNTIGIDITDEVETFYVPDELKGKLKFVRTRGEKTPFGDATFDIILMSEVLPMIPEPGDFFKEVLRILKPGGRIVTVNPLERKGVKQGYDNNSGIIWLMKTLGLAPGTYAEYTHKLQESFGTALRKLPPLEFYHKLLTDYGLTIEKEVYTPSAASQELFEKIQFFAFCVGMPTYGAGYFWFYPLLKAVDMLSGKKRGTGCVIVARKKK